MVKIAVSAQGPMPDDATDARFGRAGCFVVYDSETSEWSAMENTASRDMAHGAGLAAVETIAQAGVTILLTKSVGPKAEAALNAAKIVSCENAVGGSVRQSVTDYLIAQGLSEATP